MKTTLPCYTYACGFAQQLRTVVTCHFLTQRGRWLQRSRPPRRQLRGNKIKEDIHDGVGKGKSRQMRQIIQLASNLSFLDESGTNNASNPFDRKSIIAGIVVRLVSMRSNLSRTILSMLDRKPDANDGVSFGMIESNLILPAADGRRRRRSTCEQQNLTISIIIWKSNCSQIYHFPSPRLLNPPSTMKFIAASILALASSAAGFAPQSTATRAASTSLNAFSVSSSLELKH